MFQPVHKSLMGWELNMAGLAGVTLRPPFQYLESAKLQGAV